MVISTRAGMHRVSWDMRYQPIGEGGGRGGGGAAVPHRTYPSVNAPWAGPGAYVVRLTAGGKTYTQPLTLRLDPRVKTSPAALATLTSLTREMYDGARSARAAYDQARALAAQLDAVPGDDTSAFKTQLLALAPPPPAGGGRGGFGAGFGGPGGRGGPPAAPTLDSVSAAMMAAAMAMQAADAPPTAREVAACADARRQAADLTARWTKLKTTDLAALNARRKGAGQPAIVIPK
jgi:hypothetical protein